MTNPALFQYINPVADFSMTYLSFIKNMEESNNGDEDIDFSSWLLREGRFQKSLKIFEEKKENRVYITQNNHQKLHRQYDS